MFSEGLLEELKKYKFEVERYNVVKYKNSPYYKGAEVWDTFLYYGI